MGFGRFKYYMMVDNSVQWATIVIKIEENDNQETVIDSFDLSNKIEGDFVSNITSRELHFSNRTYLNGWWSGWSISEHEYCVLKRLQELRILVEEYNSLCKL